MIDPNQIHQKIIEVSEAWANAQYEADQAEGKRKRVYSAMVIHYTEQAGSVAKAEHLARASEAYASAESEANDKALAANLARAKKDAANIYWEAVRTVEATKRMEIGLR